MHLAFGGHFLLLACLGGLYEFVYQALGLVLVDGRLAPGYHVGHGLGEVGGIELRGSQVAQLRTDAYAQGVT